MSCTRPGLSKALLFVVMSGVAVFGRAATKTWSLFPENGNWSNGNNWQGGLAPSPGDDLVFASFNFDGNMTNDFTGGLVVRSIRFDSNLFGLMGNALTFPASVRPFNIACTSNDLATETNTFSVPIVIPGGLVLQTILGCGLELNGGISGAGGLAMDGGGLVVLGGDNSYAGETTVESGFLVIDGTLSGTSVVEIRAASGTSRLQGSGSFTAPLIAGSTAPGGHVSVAPGDGLNTGTLSTGAAAFGLNASLVVRLNGMTAGADYDQLRVTGAVDLGGTTTLAVVLGFAPPDGTAFTIIKNNSGIPVSGAFAGLPESAIFVDDNRTFQISYVGGEGQDVVLTVIPTVAMPAAMAVDPGGNGVLEPGELAALQPTWTNTSGLLVHLTGTTSSFLGPAGPLYDNPDASGDYGAVSDGASAPCVDCYSIQITADPPGSRPVSHWDTTIRESVSPGSISTTWKLHVGESFQDVPTSQPFYAFIENLFHSGVTGGCGGEAYCPDSPATRGQMAIFLLKGEHGSDYVPPGCAATVFTDVPCPGGEFVDWINQLASESITAGCGGGKYCPGDPISRGQMAVFLLKGEHGGGYAPPPCAETVFDDVPCPGAPFVDWINQLVSEGITAGCGDGNYCPEQPVDRGQMAVFLVKTFGMVLYGL